MPNLQERIVSASGKVKTQPESFRYFIIQITTAFNNTKEEGYCKQYHQLSSCHWIKRNV